MMHLFPHWNFTTIVLLGFWFTILRTLLSLAMLKKHDELLVNDTNRYSFDID